MSDEPVAADARQSRQFARQKEICEAVMAEGPIRIDELAERFGISLMTVHRDLDELEGRGLLRKTRGTVTATSTSLVESSDVYRLTRQLAEKESLALAALQFVEPGQALILDDSTTVLRLARHLPRKAPLTVITSTLTLMNELRGASGLTIVGVGGQYYNWCSAFMGPLAVQAIRGLHADILFMSTSAIINDVAFHQHPEIVETKRAMFDAASRRVLLADHTKFGKQALYSVAPLPGFDAVIVDSQTPAREVDRMRSAGINVLVAPVARPDHGSSAS
jgi:DeoR/GlpR family transcriptional regulator of sugar metabolism